MSRQEKTPEKFPPLGHPLESPPEEETQNILHIFPSDVIVMSMATRLDLKSLGMFIQVCHHTYSILNSQTYVWKSMLRHLDDIPEQNKTGAEHKAHAKDLIFHRPIQAICAKHLPHGHSLSLGETKELHDAFLKVRGTLPKFFEEPEETCKAFILFDMEVSRIFGANARRTGVYYDLLQDLKGQYASVEVSSGSCAMMDIFFSCFASLPIILPKYYGYDFQDQRLQISAAFVMGLSSFCSVLGNYRSGGEESLMGGDYYQQHEGFRNLVNNILNECKNLLPNEENEQEDDSAANSTTPTQQ